MYLLRNVNWQLKYQITQKGELYMFELSVSLSLPGRILYCAWEYENKDMCNWFNDNDETLTVHLYRKYLELKF